MNELHNKTPLVPLKRVTKELMKSIKIGENFFDLARLGLVGEYTEVPATDYCPRLYYRWNYKEGRWEIYATEHDLLGYSVASSSEVDEDVAELTEDVKELEVRVEKLEEYHDEPIPTPEPDPEVPSVPYAHSCISRDPDLVGGTDLKILRDGGLFIFAGNIKYYHACCEHGFSEPGNYVGVMIRPTKDMWRAYKNTLKIEFEGNTYDKSICSAEGALVLYMKITDPGQEFPITLTWNDEFREPFIVATTQESKLLN